MTPPCHRKLKKANLNLKDVKKLSKELGIYALEVERLTQDASNREYFRVDTDSESYIFCYLDPKIGSHDRFIKISKYLEYGVGPKVVAFDLDLGITIQEDLGDHNLYSTWIWNVDAWHPLSDFVEGFYNDVEDVLDCFKETKFPKSLVKRVSLRKLQSQMETFQDIFLKKFLNIDLDSIEMKDEKKLLEALQKETIEKLSAQKWVNCHTDFEGRNILNPIAEDYKPWNGGMYLIDFQDTCIGPEGIDLAGIYVDHYHGITLPPDGKKRFSLIRWGGIQRNMRILGTLSNLYLENNRSFRLMDLPLIHENLVMLVPDSNKYKKLKNFFTTTITDKILMALQAVERNKPGSLVVPSPAADHAADHKIYNSGLLEFFRANTAMILAAGYGKRMLPLTKDTPKPLLEVNGVSLLDRNIQKVLDADIENIFINTSYQSKKIEDHVRKKYKSKNISILHEEEILGTGGGLINANSYFTDDWILVINADIYIDIDMYKFKKELLSVPWYVKAILVGCRNPDHNKSGDFSMPRGVPKVNLKKNTHTWTGVSLIHSSVLNSDSYPEKCFDSWEHIILPLFKKGQVAAIEHQGTWLDVGTPERLELANQIVKAEN